MFLSGSMSFSHCHAYLYHTYPPNPTTIPQDASLGSVSTRLVSIEGLVGEGGSGLDDAIRKQTRSLQEKMMETINAMQEDMDHKFSLQVAENKRMQQHLSNTKRENQALTKRGGEAGFEERSDDAADSAIASFLTSLLPFSSQTRRPGGAGGDAGARIGRGRRGRGLLRRPRW